MPFYRFCYLSLILFVINIVISELLVALFPEILRNILMGLVDPKNTIDDIWRYADLFKLFIMY